MGRELQPDDAAELATPADAMSDTDRVEFHAWNRDSGDFAYFVETGRWWCGADVIVVLIDARTGRRPRLPYYAVRLQNRYGTLDQAVQALRDAR